jgi:hypothetical protein
VLSVQYAADMARLLNVPKRQPTKAFAPLVRKARTE